jgi:hypothetical protein
VRARWTGKRAPRHAGGATRRRRITRLQVLRRSKRSSCSTRCQFQRKPRGGHLGTPTERSAAFKASAHASSASRPDTSSPLAQELAVCDVENEDTTCRSWWARWQKLQAKCQTESRAGGTRRGGERRQRCGLSVVQKAVGGRVSTIAVQEGKAGQGRNPAIPAVLELVPPSLTLLGSGSGGGGCSSSSSSRARSTTTRRRRRMRCSARELPATRRWRWPTPRAFPRARVPGLREAHLTADSAPTDLCVLQGPHD